MILHLSMMIASSLPLRLQIQNSTSYGGLSRGVYLTSPHHSICGPAARWEKKEARDTLALPAKGVALCTPLMEQNPDGTIETEMPAKGVALCTPCMSGC